MQTDYTITDADVGRVLPVQDGYLVNLTRTQSGKYEVPTFDEGRQVFTAGYLQLRGSNDYRNLICLDARNHLVGGSPVVAANHSLGYRGGLKVLAVPRGSIWSLTLSDVPNVRAAHGTPPTARRAAAMIDAATAPV